MLDFFLASVRKEPHSRIYFSPSLDLALGRLLRPDCDAPHHAQRFVEPPGHLQLYQLFPIRQAPVTIILARYPQPCGPVQKAAPRRVILQLAV